MVVPVFTVTDAGSNLKPLMLILTSFPAAAGGWDGAVLLGAVGNVPGVGLDAELHAVKRIARMAKMANNL
jgi:hypothetical protein